LPATSHVVGVAVPDRVSLFELAVVYEVFGVDRSDVASPWYELRTCAAAALPDADTVLVPCGAEPATPALLDALRVAHAAGRRIVSLCTGAYVLAAAGLLDGRRATTHWMAAADFASRYPKVRLDPSALYVDDGDILTSAGTGAAVDLCLYLVQRDHGAAAANEVARQMVVPAYRPGGQAQFAPPVDGAATRAGLGPLLDWARCRLDQPLTVPRLAQEAHLRPRTFARRFRGAVGASPLQWLLQQRVRLAQDLLETTDRAIGEIARQAGFGTGASLRRHFVRVVGASPQAYRHAVRRRAAAARAGRG
jgi:transcriptional regulator GlxA family with amidase domain